MKNQNSKSRFWLVLTSVNIISLLLLSSPLFQIQNDAARLCAVLVLMVGLILLAAADVVSIVFAYWDCIDASM